MSEASGMASNPSRPQHRDVAYCPHCGEHLPVESLVVELWEADETVHHLWCNSCGMACDVVQAEKVTAHEPEH
ncbi:MAG: hypothetical protein L0G70_00430 [Rubrobacter sp.]|nr:hypothetical protein [Rubrobacter sp.]